MKAAALFLAVYGGLGAVLGGGSAQWPMLLFPAGAFALAQGSRLARAVAVLLGLALAGACAFVSWRAGHNGGAEWFVERFQLTALFWLGISALLAAPLFRRDGAPDAEPQVLADETPGFEPATELEPA